MNLIPYRYGYTRAALDAFDNLLSSAPFNSSLTKLSISFVNHFLSLSISLILPNFYNFILKVKILFFVVCPLGIEPRTYRLKADCSNQLS